MTYKNNLKESLMSEKIIDSWTGQSFKLSYDYYETEVELEDKKVNTIIKSNLEKMSEQNIRDYISSKYIKKYEIEMEKLIKDLIVFKAYKAKIEERLEFSKMSREFSAFYFAVFSTLLSVNFEISDDTRCILLGCICLSMIILPYFFNKAEKKDRSTYGSLQNLDYAISILEAIKEDAYAQSERVTDIKKPNKGNRRFKKKSYKKYYF